MLIKRLKEIINCNSSSLFEEEKKIGEKIARNERISAEEGLFLYEKASLSFLSLMSSLMKQKISGKKVFFNKNIHIEPTNVCVFNCKFCSFKRRFGDKDAWYYSIEDIINMVKKYKDTDITEIHITGGVYPHYNLLNYCTLLKKIRNILPNVHIKAFTAVEIDFMNRKARLTNKEGLKRLIDCGLGSLPGGGAEIFDSTVREKVCGEKSTAKLWLDIHRTAHLLNLKSNATMLYGHVEKYEHRIDHLTKIRKLQDETGGFNAFIPLKFRNTNNKLSHIPEVSFIEDMRNFAVTRIFLDNIPHIKAYWVMIGKEHAQMALTFGVDDLDGTIDDTTKIYSMAGAEDATPKMTANEIIALIKDAKLIPVQRDSLYKEIEIYN